MKLARWVFYYALWPVELLVAWLTAVGTLFKWILIASNPLFLAIYLMNRNRRRREDQRH